MSGSCHQYVITLQNERCCGVWLGNVRSEQVASGLCVSCTDKLVAALPSPLLWVRRPGTATAYTPRQHTVQATAVLSIRHTIQTGGKTYTAIVI